MTRLLVLLRRTYGSARSFRANLGGRVTFLLVMALYQTRFLRILSRPFSQITLTMCIEHEAKLRYRPLSMDLRIVEEVWVEHVYSGLAEAVAPTNGVVLDLGAHIGVFALF